MGVEVIVSTCRLDQGFIVPKTIVNDIIKKQLLHPYHVQIVQELLPIDRSMRLTFCQLLIYLKRKNP